MITATGAVLRDPQGPFTIEEVALDEPRAGEILVRIEGAGLCHTDMIARHQSGAVGLPMIFGHEGAGIVEAIGSGVSSVEIGDPVLMTFASCGRCVRCLGGEPAYCLAFVNLNLLGRRPDGTFAARSVSGEPLSSRWFGQSSFASHSVTYERNVIKVDHDLPLHLMGPLGCSVQTGAGSVLVAMGVRPGDTIAVFGVGPVGLAAIMAAKVASASKILAVDINAERRALAVELGATHEMDGADPGLVDRIREITGGGVNFALDTSGVPSAITAAVASLQVRGFCGLVGVGTPTLQLDTRAFTAGRTISYIIEGGVVPQIFIPRLVDLWQAGRFPFDRLVKIYSLSDVNQAEADSASGRAIKPVLRP